MKVYRVMKAAAVFAAVCGLAAVFVASDARAQQGDVPPGQEKKIDPNNGNNGGLPPGQVNNPNSNRVGNCNGGNARGCSDNAPPPPQLVTDVEDSEVIIIDCLLPQYKNDPLCYIPAKKPAKRKVVSVKLDQNELAVTPPAATPAPAPAPVAPASVTNSSPKSSSTLPEANDIGSTNFQ